MSSVGSCLRELRERRGVSLEEIARSTRVLHQYLQALEADDATALPAPVFTKGFIRAYCQALGVAPDEVLALYEQGQAAGAGEARPRVAGFDTALGAGGAGPADRRREGSGRSAVLMSFVLLVVLGLALFAVAFWLRPARELRNESRPIVPVAAETPVGSQMPPPKTDAATDAPAAMPQAPGSLAGVTSPYRLVARTSERTWMRVRTGDGRASEENIPAGETREWVSNRPFVLTIGNAGGVALELNGRDVPPLGPRGAVIERLVLPSEGQ